MASTPSSDLVYACLTHVPMWFAYPDFVQTIHLGEAQGPGRINLKDLAPEWHEHHHVLGGSAGAFALKHYVIRDYPGAKQIAICQYRKFVSTRKIGVNDGFFTPMDVVSLEAVQSSPLAELMHPQQRSFLIARAWSLHGETEVPPLDYLSQYEQAHQVEDLLRFTAAAVEEGVLARGEAHSFFKELAFFAGGLELGCFPADFWLKSMSAMEAVVRRCIATHSLRRTGYQARAWSFCMERLGSYMLLRHLRAEYPDRPWPMENYGYLNVVADDGTMKSCPRT